MEDKDDEDATSKYCNKKEKQQTSSFSTAPAPTAIAAIATKMTKITLSKLLSVRRIIVRNGHSIA
jgi:hypothetical protein